MSVMGHSATWASTNLALHGPLRSISGRIPTSHRLAQASLLPVGQLGIATTGDVSNLQSQINHLGRGVTQANRPLPGGENRPLPGGELRHGRTMTGADAKPPQAEIAGP